MITIYDFFNFEIIFLFLKLLGFIVSIIYLVISKSLASNISFTNFFIIVITYLVIVLNNFFILKNKNRKILFDNKKIFYIFYYY